MASTPPVPPMRSSTTIPMVHFCLFIVYLPWLRSLALGPAPRASRRQSGSVKRRAARSFKAMRQP